MRVVCSPSSRPYYYYTAGPIFRGPVAVHAGLFTGRFVVPPIYAESMYQRSVYAQGGPAGMLQVTATKP